MYVYAANNPVNYTDPTGGLTCSDAAFMAGVGFLGALAGLMTLTTGPWGIVTLSVGVASLTYAMPGLFEEC